MILVIFSINISLHLRSIWRH